VENTTEKVGNVTVPMFLKIVLGSSIFALFVCLVLGGLSSSGVPSMMGTHILFIVATFSAIVGVVTSEIIFHQSRLVIILSGILTLSVVGGTLFALDRYLQKQRSQLDALLTPPNPVAPKPPVSAEKRSGKREASVSQSGNHNQQLTLQNSPVTQQSTGNCSPNQIGVNNTNNCVLPPRKLSDDERAQMVQYLSSTKSKLVIGSLIGDDEAAEFATVLAGTFERSGWTVDKLIGRQMQSGVSAEAVTLSLYALPGSTTTDNQTAVMAVNALRSVGIRVAINFDSSLTPDTVNLYVGARRPDKP